MAALRLACLLFIVTSAYGDDAVLDTTSGKLKGLQEQVEGRLVNAFLGVPYAEPPVDDFRFKRARKIQPRSATILDATRKPPSCYQLAWNLEPDYFEPEPKFSEDCLYLNIWIPVCQKATCAKKAIMIFFHGGSYTAGSSNVPAYHGAGLAALGDVVVVVINYRLGIFGFFDANHPDGAENNGFHDQLEALKWVKENAENFEADPDKITLFGESAGSSSITCHLISPISRDLFKRVIMQSGCAFSPWSLDNPQRALVKGDDLARLVGCSREGLSLMSHPEEVMKCLREKSAKELLDAEHELGYPTLFKPVYNSEFLPHFHNLAIKRGDFKSTEILLGVNKQEGASILHILDKNTFKRKSVDGLREGDLLNVLDDFKKVWKFGIEQKDVDLYFKSVQKGDAKGTLVAIADFAGDLMMNCPCAYFTDYFTDRGNKLYRYLFVLHGNKSNLLEWSGTTHLDELPYVFGYTLVEPDKFTEDDRTFTREIINIWSTFAKTGAPPKVDGKDWPAYTRDNPVYFELNPDDYGVKSGWRKEQCDRIKYGFQ